MNKHYNILEILKHGSIIKTILDTKNHKFLYEFNTNPMNYQEKSKPLVSVLINNYNYGHFLKDAIDSVLNQTYSSIEIIVVDDGSTDDSKDIIMSYTNKIIPIFRKNGGQGSALNAGWKASQGEIICFLDSDDIFYPQKVEECINLISNQQAIDLPIIISHHLDIVDKQGTYLGNQKKNKLQKYVNYSNFYEFACKYKCVPFATGPTSGNVVTRALAQRIFPIPEYGVRTSADDFIVRTALLLGKTYNLNKSLGQYRVHGQNNWSNGLVKSHSKEFLQLQEIFMNTKLQENNMKPVISYLQSMEAAQYYKVSGSKNEYIKFGFRVFISQPDLTTFNFFKQTLKVTIKNKIKHFLGIKRPSL